MNFDCGGVLTGPSGYLASIDANRDGQYDNSQDCQWTISLEYTYVILFEVLKQDILQTEELSTCQTDFLAVRTSLDNLKYLLLPFNFEDGVLFKRPWRSGGYVAL